MALCGVASVAPLVLPGQGGGHADHLVVLGLQVHLAAVPAVVARGRRLPELPGLVEILGILVRDGADRADRQAVSAELTRQRRISLRDDLREPALLDKLQGVDHQHVFAHVDALTAGDAAVHVEIQDRAAGVLRDQLLLGVGQIRDLVLERHVLQFTMPVRVADRAIQRMDGQMFLHRFFSGLKEVIAIGPDHHAGRGFRGAGADGRLLAFHRDQAHAAGPERIEGVVVAHRGDDLPRVGDHVVERHPVLGGHGPPVNGQLDGRRLDVRSRDWLQCHACSSRADG